MRHTKFAGSLTAIALAAALLVVSPAATGSSSAEPSAQPSVEPNVEPLLDVQQDAVEVLSTVEATLADPEQTEVTTALVQLQQVYDDLPAAERRVARGLLARPDDPTYNPGRDLLNYRNAPVGTVCNTRICVHWTETKRHAVIDDGDLTTVPAWVNTTLSVVDQVWTQEIDVLGYRRPTSDGTRGNPAGNTTPGLLDVYLGELGPNYYGYANWDPTAQRGGYLVLDNGFTEFHLPPLKSLQATAAHEFFHVVQFAYQRKTDPWVMESSATWMEEVVFDAVNDNRQYLRFGSLAQPFQSLDAPGFSAYGNWIFFEYLSLRHGPDVVRNIWQRLGNGKLHSLQAINRALKARGTNLADEFTAFSAANTVPGRTYVEGSAYPRPRTSAVRRLSRTRADTGWIPAKVDHLASTTQPFRAKGRLGKAWRLRIFVDGGRNNQRARVLVHRADGRVITHNVRLKRGDGRVTVAFASRLVKKVTVTAANGSSAYVCKKGTALTCKGRPKHDNQTIRVRARLVRGS